MKHHPDEQHLALFAGGDCVESDRRQIERHVGTCDRCSQVVDAFRQDLILLADSQPEPASQDLADLRQRVMARVPAKSPSYLGWRWLAVPLAAVIAAAVLRIPTRQPIAPIAKEPELRSQVISVSPKLVVAELPSQARPKHRKHQQPGLREVQLVAVADKPAVLKMKTQDPNVVILWQMDNKEQVNE